MTVDQEKVAEHLVQRMKDDGKDSINWRTFQGQQGYTYNDVLIAVQGLKIMNIISEYPNKPSSIHFVAPEGQNFTTFAKYRQDQINTLNYQRKINKWLIAATILAAVVPLGTFIVDKIWFSDNVVKQSQPVAPVTPLDSSSNNDAQ